MDFEFELGESVFVGTQPAKIKARKEFLHGEDIYDVELIDFDGLPETRTFPEHQVSHATKH